MKKSLRKQKEDFEMAYTPGLKRKEFVLLRKKRTLPVTGDVLVKEGVKVHQDTVIARSTLPGEPETVKLGDIMGIDSEVERIEDYLIKKEGDYCEKDEIIAKYSFLWGLSKKICRSPIAGTIESISKVTGWVVLRSSPVPLEINAYIPGSIRKVIPKEGAIVETIATYIQGIFGLGQETHGILKIVESWENIGLADAGKILVIKGSPPIDILRKMTQVGVKGIILGGINAQDLTTFMGYEIGVAITGQESGPVLIVTEGFGEKMVMSEKTYNLLKKYEGKEACINGATQLRAGVIRPEIIIPHDNIDRPDQTTYDVEDTKALSAGLRPGTPIRIIREPNFGVLAHVIDLPPELWTLETGSKVRVLIAETEDKRRIIVPRANVEIIGE
jgi:hypothetical protein